MELNERSVELAIMEELVTDKVPITVSLTNGFQFRGVVVRYDTLVIVLLCDGKQKIVYKHSISAIEPIKALKFAQSKIKQ